jgi:uncharacterized membrane protein
MLIDYLYKNKPAKTGDHPYKSLLKTFSWRLIGTLDTVFISYLIIGDTAMAFSIGFVELFSKMVLYYLHERLWSKVG